MEKNYQKSYSITPLFVSLFVFLSLIQVSGETELDVDRFLGIKAPTAIAWSPDGTHIAFQVKNFMGNEIHVYCPHEAKVKKLVSDIPPYGYLEVTTYQNPEPLLRWTSDGQRIIYTTGKDLYSVPLQGGEPDLLFESPKKAKLIQISPDIKHVSYIKKGELWVQSLEGGESRQLTNKAGFLTVDYQRFSRLIQWPQWSPDGSKIACLWPHKGTMKVGIVSIQDGETTWLIPEETLWGFLILRWSPDSSRIAVSMLSADFKRKELVVHSATGDSSHTIWKDSHDKWVSHNIDPNFGVSWSHDSSRLAFLSNRDGWKHLYVSDAEGNTVKQLTKGNFKNYLCFWAPGDEDIFFVSNKGNHHQRLIWAIPSDGGEVRQITKNIGVCLGNVAGRGWALPHFSPNGEKIVYTFTDPSEPPGLWVSQISGAAGPEQFYSSLPEDQRNKIKTQMKPVSFLSSDGTRIPAVLLTTKDLNQNEKHPALIYMYGGWGQNALLGWALEIKTLLFSFLAHKGYVILIVDPRGSEGYGEDLAKGLYLEGGGKQVDDLVAGAQYLGDLGFVDPMGIGIFGHSYGSYLAVQTMVQAPDSFAAGIAQAGVYDWVALGGDGGAYVRLRFGTSKDTPNLLKERNPINYIEKLRGKILVVHGSGDYNAPMTESEKLVNALMMADKEFDYMVYPQEPHGWIKPEIKKDFFKRVARFLDRYLRRPNSD
jgi:dipeptidyl-peptidase-4